jgi:S-adenosylmethionine hydrolase
VDAPDTIYFLSDYGLRDTFVGIVHAVLRRLAPRAAVVDLTHEVAPFDVRGGALALAHAVPHLGPGVVLAVVDPGVGGRRRCVAVEVPSRDDAHPGWFVGPDNGLLTPALDAVSGVSGLDRVAAFALPEPAAARDTVTFDGRDVLAPAAAAICRGDSFGGVAVDLGDLIRLPAPVVEHDTGNGRPALRAEVIGIDRFGNVQLAARRADLPDALPAPGDAETSVHVTVSLLPSFAHPERMSGSDMPNTARWVSTFADLEPGEFGLLVDSDGCLALVMAESSAAGELCIVAGDLVELTI